MPEFLGKFTGEEQKNILKYFFLKKDKPNLVPTVFYETMHPTDIDYFYPICPRFMSVLYCLAENVEYITKLFITKNFNSEFYRVTFCLNGLWKEITIDSYFPCKPFAGPMFIFGKSKSLWSQILEKAYAKVKGGYFKVKEIPMTDMLYELTGCPTFELYLSDVEKVSKKGYDKSQHETLGAVKRQPYERPPYNSLC